ncbi:mannose-1-phosphate guanylyltransferase/mannose-6-phosphate isomerase [Oharaeibacter diazotrophicus]|uniref:mannose-1-phosphate guanylyltransferase n=1 Tax=Oharaeibacter diazotrophicus TaxID=1920512 RepID=A0A4R6RB18_9HYPH|nr:mannose-1-phosphate guanylyltransferase/mannose-6-phosphate isomerase [Oharaeibacter diazotrophicus]TDP83310.1 mannose-1-phosphate guanylyltransferase (GDP) /mannose-6-phosphate isomerase type 2 [Oharaeibacter diazotrophicus]BBE72144.1 mannose-1-phosphate guanylyltransferase 1 [Pleomorphomonas sp. SM30]GLS78910.1 mannose-1-phosphate guanylyltransferase/mannose-6-phosphate isomerase [Oharaeibacter diazotrophicus]
MTSKIVPVILAGGSGTRLWPVSRDAFPKQFQPLVGEESTYQQTLRRVAAGPDFADPVVITSGAFRFFARRQASEVGADATVILEPARRDSAAAVAAAAVFAERRNPGSLVLALAADHVVLDDEGFREAVRAGKPGAEAGRIVVFGLVPTEPKTAYGYIRPGAPLGEDPDLCAVESFVEKPDAPTAVRYCTEGYLWNCGNFLFRSDVMIAEFRRYAPEILDAVEAAVGNAADDIGFVRLDEASFSRAPKISIDYAVIEKTREIAVVRCRFPWSDVGAWDAIWQVTGKDGAGNATLGDVELIGSQNCLVHAHGLLATVVGAEDLVVIASQDAVMVAPKNRAQEVKGLVDKLAKSGRREATQHRRDYRPWGYVEAIDAGARFAVKRIVVDPGGVLSMHRHLHRAEHWVVVKGSAILTIPGEAERVLGENQSFYVPVGTTHRLSNRGRLPLELIEVRTGGYLDEDDKEFPVDPTPAIG